MAQPQSSVITDEMRAQIGVESEPVTYEVDKTGCRMFARAVGYTDPIHFDEVNARGKGYRDIVAPFAFLGHPIYDPNASRRPGPFRFQTQFKRILNGGTDIEYFDTVCAGDVLSATSKVVDISEKEGRLGPMLIVNTETTYRNQDGNVVAIQRGAAIQY